ncbi:GFA family protein [Mesobacterium pallidum]|uniref:GFA family protein n=1 Tax=Mesobacterium pallidum TaxID=2872037 RepID=UPI001EE2C00A|nr:GFA family protein [Mesobacterium pallidum]
MTTNGQCLCGAVRLEITGPLGWTVHCHCQSCRRQTASPMTTFVGLRDRQLRWAGVAPMEYESSPGVRRMFCGTCGSPVAFQADRYPGEVHIYACLLDEAASLRPTEHVHWEERLPWMHPGDDLTKTEGFGAP